MSRVGILILTGRSNRSDGRENLLRRVKNNLRREAFVYPLPEELLFCLVRLLSLHAEMLPSYSIEREEPRGKMPFPFDVG